MVVENYGEKKVLVLLKCFGHFETGFACFGNFWPVSVRFYIWGEKTNRKDTY